MRMKVHEEEEYMILLRTKVMKNGKKIEACR